MNQMTPEQQLQAVISKLPRSVVDFHEDGSISIHAVDMVQAQIDLQKSIGMLQQRLQEAYIKAEKVSNEHLNEIKYYEDSMAAMKNCPYCNPIGMRGEYNDSYPDSKYEEGGSEYMTPKGVKGNVGPQGDPGVDGIEAEERM